MKTTKTLGVLHPIMVDCVKKIQSKVIEKHNVPIRLFETGRTRDRHKVLLGKGKSREILSRHLYDLKNDPPLYATAIDYVYFNDNKWSWNLRDCSINAWFVLFGNLVLDECPEIEWAGMNRKATNFCHFQLRERILIENLDRFRCVIPS